MSKDRNFDDLAERFQRKVYGGLKGDIRLAVLWRDIDEQLPQLHGGASLRVLDVGAGFGQLAIRLAKLGHQVTVNDISNEMLSAAKASAEEFGVADKIFWHHCPFQELSKCVAGPFDLVLCHAVVEWLADPEPLIVLLKSFLAPTGLLSFTYYNRHSLEYRNLIRGNFNLLKRDSFAPDPGSLTPGNPLLSEQVQPWLDNAGLSIQATSGVRVFHDYVTTSRGGHGVPESVIEMELMYSQREPFMWLGRYIHLLLKHST
ncbi:MAG: methyltransferase domain-containing protein [Porticoccus sp.]|nr:methyltransferase domain-containing protein [Porticoccus sp.]